MDSWIDKLVEEMGLGDTVPPEDVPETRVTLLELIRTLEFTVEGWKKVRKALNIESQAAKSGLLQDILDASPEDLRMFMAMIQMPYLLGKHIRYTDAEAEQLAMLMVMAFHIMAARGYELGRQSLESPGTPGSEGPG